MDDFTKPWPTVLQRLGVEAYSAGAYADAIAYLEEAVRQDPMMASAWNALGGAYSALRLRPAALVCHERATQIEPESPDYLSNLGHELFKCGRFEEAERKLRKAVAIPPLPTTKQFGIYHNLGLTLIALERWTDAIIALARAETLAPPEYRPQIEFDLAHALMADADFAMGWRSMGARSFGLDKLPAESLPAKNWTGEPLYEQSLLIFHEQGFGDTIQFSRFVEVVRKKYGGDITFAVPKELVRLFDWMACKVIDQDGPLPITDYKVPLMSIPGILSVRLDTIPLFRITPQWVYVSSTRGKFAIGICWAGGHSGTDTDRARSMEIDDFLPLAAIPGVSLHSLQVGDRARDIYSRGAGVLVEDLSPKLTDFAETAAWIMGLDLVVTCDTAVAHLAATLGKPTFILSRYVGCWRWMGRKNERSPWYPSVRLFHQAAPGDWAHPMDLVEIVVRGLVVHGDEI